MSERAAILMAGGAGTRLWPLSTDDNPKQFLPLFEGRSLLQLSYQRIRGSFEASQIFVSTNDRYHSKIIAQLPQLLPGNIVLEPTRRNTAPAIAISCEAVSRAMGGDPIIGTFHSDHYIADEPAFLEVVERAYAHAAAERTLMTIGIQPDRPETGFGYLELGETLAPGVIRLRRFVEKPDRNRAEEFLQAGNFVWNGGMFVWRHSVFMEALRAAAPEIHDLAIEYTDAPENERASIYGRMPSIAIDHAVMEKAKNLATVRGEFGWSDVGSWKAVAAHVKTLPAGSITEAASDVFIATESGKRIVVVGVSNVAVVEAADGILVIDLARSDALSSLVKRLG